jgi:hypothetical protein
LKYQFLLCFFFKGSTWIAGFVSFLLANLYTRNSGLLRPVYRKGKADALIFFSYVVQFYASSVMRDTNPRKMYSKICERTTPTPTTESAEADSVVSIAKKVGFPSLIEANFGNCQIDSANSKPYAKRL